MSVFLMQHDKMSKSSRGMNPFARPNRDIFPRLNDVQSLSVVRENVLRFLFSSQVTLIIQAQVIF